MINPIHISQDKRDELEKVFKAEYPELVLHYSPAFRHYYIVNTTTKEKSDNISAYELYNRLITNK